MAKPTYKDLLDAGVHFGHLKKKWNPKMAPYIFMERKGIHIIDLNRTIDSMDRAASAMRQIAKSGKKILFVATKKTISRYHQQSSTERRHALCNRTLVRWYDDQLFHYQEVH